MVTRWSRRTVPSVALGVAALLEVAHAAQFAPSCSFVEARLTASDAAPQQWIGTSLAASANTLVVGAPRDGQGGVDAGAAYVFVLGSGGWTQQAKLVPLAAHAGDRFGTSVALDGERVLVGAPGFDGASTDAGAAYVFERSGSTWNEVAVLSASDGAAHDAFGLALALDGCCAWIGAPRADAGAHDSGAAYAFLASPGAWLEHAKFVAPQPRADLHLGSSVTIDGDTAAVGADATLSAGDPRELVFVLRRHASGWRQEARLCAPDAGFGVDVDFGRSLDLDGERLAVGAALAREGGFAIGAVYTFVRTVEGWSFEAKLVASDGAALDQLGQSVALRGERLVAGAYGDDIDRGAAYVFARDASLWRQTDKLRAQPPHVGDALGWAVAIASTRVFASAPSDDAAAADAGAVWVFGVSGVDTYCLAKTNSVGCTPQISASGTPSPTDPGPFEIRATSVLNQETGLLFYGLHGRQAVPFLGGTLCIRAPLARTPLALTGGNPLPHDCSGVLSLDFNERIRSGVDPGLVPGASVDVQFWYRDPAASWGTGLSDALEFRVCS